MSIIKIMEKSDNIKKDLKKTKHQKTLDDDAAGDPYSNPLPFTSTSIDKDEWNRNAFKPWSMDKNDPILKYKKKIHQNCDNPKKSNFIIRKITDPSEVKIIRRYEEGRHPIFQRSDILPNYYHQISDDQITSTTPTRLSTSPQKLRKSPSPQRKSKRNESTAKVKKRLRSPSVHDKKLTKRVTRQKTRIFDGSDDKNSSDSNRKNSSSSSSSSTSDNDNRRHSSNSNSDGSSSPRYRYRRRGDKFKKRESSTSTSRLRSTRSRTSKHDSKIRDRSSSKVKNETVPYFTDKARETERLERLQNRQIGRTVRSKSRSPSSRSTQQQGVPSTSSSNQISTSSQTNEPQHKDEIPLFSSSSGNILQAPIPPPPEFFIRPYPPGMMGRGMRIGLMVPPPQPHPPYLHHHRHMHPSHMNYSHMEYRPRMLPPQLVPPHPHPHLPNEMFFRPRFNKFPRRPRN